MTSTKEDALYISSTVDYGYEEWNGTYGPDWGDNGSAADPVQFYWGNVVGYTFCLVGVTLYILSLFFRGKFGKSKTVSKLIKG